MYIEVVAIGFVWFNAEEVFNLLFHSGHVFAFTDILSIKTIAQEYQVDATVVAFSGCLLGNDFIFGIDVVVLRYGTLMSIVFVFQFEDNFANTSS